MSNKRETLQRYINNSCSEEERQLVEYWFESEDFNVFSERDVELATQRLDRKFRGDFPGKIRKLSLWTWSAAACLIVAMSSLFFYYVRTDSIGYSTSNTIFAPSSSNAFVMLSDGSKINLDELQHGDTVDADGYHMTRLIDGSLQYITSGRSITPVLNTIVTKAGGIVTVTLSDGTKIWVNSNSKISYPLSFTDTRKVQLSGEAYFEVAHLQRENERVPFYVITAQHAVQVHGTKFNINTYTSRFEAALLEGKISIQPRAANEKTSYLGKVIYLDPSEVYIDGKVSKSSNIASKIDWVEGNFYLTGLRIEDLADKLKQWYGVEIILSPKIAHQQLYGEVSRTNTLNQILELVAEVAPVKYTIQDRTVYIEPNNK